MNELSACAPFCRKFQLNNFDSQEYDLLIIGGGITGAGIALDAVSRGLKTILLEKNDFASGTSSRSTKLIHGGLRYLKDFKFLQVFHVGQERAILSRIAPHLVFPEKMILPVYKNGSLGLFSMALGLSIYDLLAGVKKTEKKKILNAVETLKAEPLLNPKDLLGAGFYYEYRTDDARLVIDILKTAVQLGSTCLNYFTVKEFMFGNGNISGVQAMNNLTGEVHHIKAKMIVNATGPWTDKTMQLENPGKKNILHHTKGVHLVIKKNKFPLRQSVYFDAADRRMIFAIPNGKVVYFGTTDTDYQGETDHPPVTRDDVNYLLYSLNKIFPSIKVTVNDIVSSWAGIRPLIQEEGKPPSEISRKDEILVSDRGLISIAGGKLTGYRRMAEKVIDIVMQRLSESSSISFVRCKTKNIMLSGAEIFSNSLPITDKYPAEILPSIQKLNRRYGSNFLKILDKFDAENSFTESALLRSEIWYSVYFEGTTTLQDFFIRRTGMLNFERELIPGILEEGTSEMGKLCGWTPEEKEKNIRGMNEEYREAINFNYKNSQL